MTEGYPTTSITHKPPIFVDGEAKPPVDTTSRSHRTPAQTRHPLAVLGPVFWPVLLGWLLSRRFRRKKAA